VKYKITLTPTSLKVNKATVFKLRPKEKYRVFNRD